MYIGVEYDTLFSRRGRLSCKKHLGKILKRSYVINTCCFIRRVHRKLRKADICCVYGHMGIGDIAKCASARFIGVVFSVSEISLLSHNQCILAFYRILNRGLLYIVHTRDGHYLYLRCIFPCYETHRTPQRYRLSPFRAAPYFLQYYATVLPVSSFK